MLRFTKEHEKDKTVCAVCGNKNCQFQTFTTCDICGESGHFEDHSLSCPRGWDYTNDNK